MVNVTHRANIQMRFVSFKLLLGHKFDFSFKKPIRLDDYLLIIFSATVEETGA
ncbi:MAG: hypothetical protein ACD_34C00336G0001 [uncultured bacterium]|nr:MAG: hypothetical protein ACD_34C00336G0001 [uncultured bacterium]